MRARQYLIAITVLTGLIVACDSTPPEPVSRDHGIAVLDSQIGPPGTALGAGLRVPIGAVLVGVALPAPATSQDSPVPARAILAVSGSPTAVARRLLEQARAASYAALPDDVSCSGDGAVGDGSTAATLGPGRSRTIRADERSGCGFASAPTPRQDPPAGRLVDVSIEREPGLGTWGVVTFADWGGQASPRREPAVLPAAAEIAARPPAPTGLPSLGERFTVAETGFDLVAGSALVLPPFPTDGSNGEALFVVTGDPATVFADYAEQSGIEPTDERRDRRRGWRTHAIADGGGSLELLARGSRTYLRIVVTPDD